MKTTFLMKIATFIIVFMMVTTGCGSPATEVPPTPLPPTETPIPPTSTPIPYMLDITVSDQDGDLVTGATVSVNEQDMVTDNTGQVSFTDIEEANTLVKVNAQGYLPEEKSITLERGSNQETLILELDPNGLAGKNACGTGEKLLYLNDFQNGNADGWDAIQLQTPGWSLEPAPEQPDNIVVAAKEGASWVHYGDPEGVEKFDNVVWRLQFNNVGNGDSHINFRFTPSGGDTRYYVALGGGNNALDRFKDGNDIAIGQLGEIGEGWHLLEIGYYNGTVTVYIDREEKATWDDPDPWDGGTIGLEPYPGKDAVFYYDNFSLCELNAPFESLPKPKTDYNLTVTVLDAEDLPLPGVSVSISELGDSAEGNQITDADGLVSWMDLPGENISLLIDAPGYYGLEEKVVIEKGNNEKTFNLEGDPFGLLLSQACRPQEKVIYVDDFQDGKAQEWDTIELGAPGWSIEKAPDQNENLVIAAREGAPWSWFGGMQKYSFNNIVWRFMFYYEGQGDSHINFRFIESGDNSKRYIIALSRGNAKFDRLEGQNHVNIRPIGAPRGGEWHLLEIGYLDGNVMIFLDGKQVANWTDSNPWEGGTLNLEPYPAKDSVFYYDNFSVCELSAPLETIKSKE